MDLWCYNMVDLFSVSIVLDKIDSDRKKIFVLIFCFLYSVTDILITGALVYYLRKATANGEHIRTNSLVPMTSLDLRVWKLISFPLL